MMVNRGSRAEDQIMAYRGSANTGGTNVVKPSGVAVGDVVLFVIPDATDATTLTLTTASGGAWTKSFFGVPAHGYQAVLFCKVLTALDVSNAWTLSNAEDGRAYAWVGNDAGSVTVKDTAVNSTAQSSLTLDGFSPDQTHAVIAVIVDRDADVTPTISAGFTIRSSATLVGNWTAAVADDPDGYTGANVVWSDTDGASGFAEYGWLVEVGPA